ncbi:ABC1 kinase family protein [Neisseria sp. Ec49-e6-T10]|uniref:ABC1 kinase family protein n=1 Tax=Neisseria sp. Ec49-e6-T10 TaxID=3140744 RepID=UPI003EBE6BEF
MFRYTFVALRDLPRMREIATVLAKYGLGGFMQRIKLFGRLSARSKANEIQKARYIPIQKRFRLAFEELGPTYVKLGQILSTRIDIFPPEWINEFSQLQNNVKPVNQDEIVALIEQSLNQPLEALFREFDPIPIGSASIAQVHRAVLHSGREVAVKVKRPNIDEKVQADLRILTRVVTLIESELPEIRRYQPKQMFIYFTRSLKQELDLNNELQLLQRFRQDFINNPEVTVPEVYPEYSNEQILVQDFVHGCLLKDVNDLGLTKLQKQTVAQNVADAILSMILIHGVFHADPHPGNIFVDSCGEITFIDFGLVGRLTAKRKEEIIGLIQALIEHDQFSMQLILSSWAQGSIPNEERLGEDVMDIMLNYEHVSLKNLKISEVINDITSLVREHQLTLPADLVMLFKTLIMLESVVRALDEDFELLEHTKPLVVNILKERHSPSQLWRKGKAQGNLLKRVLSDFPLNALYLGKHLRSGRFNINLDLKRLDDFGNQLDKTSNRLTMGIVTGSLIIGSSIVMTVDTGPKIFGLSLFGFIGYSIAFCNSLWLIWAIWRSGKH